MLARGEAAYLTSRVRARSMSKSVLLCISTLLDGGNHCASASLAVGPSTMGYADSRRPLCCADSKMFNLSDALGRPLFSNIQISLVCGKNCLLESTLLASLPTTASLVRSCVPEDRRAREVHTQVGGDAALAVVQQDGDREGHPCRRPRHAAPRVHGPCLRRHAQGLPVAPGGCILCPPANRRRLSPIRVRAPRQH